MEETSEDEEGMILGGRIKLKEFELKVYHDQIDDSLFVPNFGKNVGDCKSQVICYMS